MLRVILVPLSGSLKRLTMELLFCLDDLKHLAGRQDIHKPIMIFLLQLLHLDIQLILAADSLSTTSLVCRINEMIPTHLIKTRTHLLHHLAVNREELTCFLRSEARMDCNILLQFCLKTLDRKSVV